MSSPSEPSLKTPPCLDQTSQRRLVDCLQRRFVLTHRDAIYRLDTPIPGSSPKREGSIPEVDELLAKLAQWRACNPVLPPGRTGVPLLPKDVFDLEYYNVRRIPLSDIASVDDANASRVTRHSASRCCCAPSLPFPPRRETTR
jgi:hypothetical protein